MSTAVTPVPVSKETLHERLLALEHAFEEHLHIHHKPAGPVAEPVAHVEPPTDHEPEV